MAISLPSTPVVRNNAVGTSVTITPDASWQTGDRLIAFITLDNTGAIGVLTGWSNVTNEAGDTNAQLTGNSLSTRWITRLHDTANTSYVFTHDFASSRAHVIALRGAGVPKLLAKLDKGFSATCGPVAGDALAGDWLIFGASILGSQTFTTPSGMDERSDADSTTIATQSSVSAGNYSKSATASGAQFNHDFLFRIASSATNETKTVTTNVTGQERRIKSPLHKLLTNITGQERRVRSPLHKITTNARGTETRLRSPLHKLTTNVTATNTVKKSPIRTFVNTVLYQSTFSKSPIKVLRTNVTAVESRIRSALHKIVTNVTATARTIKSPGIDFDNSVEINSSVLKTGIRSITNVANVVSTLSKKPIKILTNTVEYVTSISKSPQRIIQNTVDYFSSLLKTPGKIIRTNVTAAIDLTTELIDVTIQWTVNTFVDVVDTVTRSPIKRINTTAIINSALIKSIMRTIAQSITVTVEMNKLIKIILDEIIDTVSSISKRGIRNIVTNVRGTNNIVRGVIKSLRTNIRVTSTLRKLYTYIITTTVTIQDTVATLLNAVVTAALRVHRSIVSIAPARRIVSFVTGVRRFVSFMNEQRRK